MEISTPSKQVTIRLAEDLYEKIKQQAFLQKVSISQLTREQLEKLTQDKADINLSDFYDLLGKDNESEYEIEQYFTAQQEVVINGGS